MKKGFVLLIITCFILGSGSVYAQNTLKIGHIDSRLVFQAMPESDSATKQLEREYQSIQKTLEELQVEFNKKYESYVTMTNDPNASPLILRTKEEELQTLQQRSQTFQQQAEETMAQRRQELFKPIQDKALKAVSDVAAENGFTYILDLSGGTIVYNAPDAQDILPMVKAKLGIK